MTIATLAQNARTMFLSNEETSIADACRKVADEHGERYEDIWEAHEEMIDNELEVLLGREGFGMCKGIKARTEDLRQSPAFIPHNRPMSRVSH